MKKDLQIKAEKILLNEDLGQNDRLITELINIMSIPERFISEWIPSEKVIEGVKNPYMPIKDKLKLLERLAKSNQVKDRLFVAEYPDTPTEILEILAGDVELPVRIVTQVHKNSPEEIIFSIINNQYQIASNWKIKPETLAILAQSQWSWIKETIAKNPYTPQESLAQLAQDDCYQVQLAVARNYATSPEVLDLLVDDYSSEIKNAYSPKPESYRSILEKQEKEKQETVLQFMAYHYRSHYDNNNPFDKYIIKFGDDEHRRLVAMKTNKSDLLINLALDKEVEVRKTVAENKNVPVEALKILAKDKVELIRNKVALSCNATENILSELAKDASVEVKQSVTKNPHTNENLLEYLWEKENVFEPNSRNLSTKIINGEIARLLNLELTEETERKLYLLLVHNLAKLSIKTLESLIELNSSTINSTLASSQHTPVSILERLGDSQDGRVLGNLTENRNTPSDVLAKIFHCHLANNQTKSHGNFFFLRGLTQNPNTPADVLDTLCDRSFLKKLVSGGLNEEKFFIRSLAYNPNLSLKSIEKLIQDEQNVDIDITPLLHPHITFETYKKLVNSPLDEVRIAIASSPKTPHEVFSLLINDSNEEVRVKLADNQYAMYDLLKKLAEDESINVRKAVASNSRLVTGVMPIQTHLLEKMAEDESVFVRQALASNSKIPVNILEKLAQENEPLIWEALINNPQISEKLRKSLTHRLNIHLNPTLKGLSCLPNAQIDDLPILLSESIESDVPFLRFLTLLHPLIPFKYWSEYAESDIWYELYAVAMNPLTPESFRENLITDIKAIITNSLDKNHSKTENLFATLEVLIKPLEEFDFSELYISYEKLNWNVSIQGKFNFWQLMQDRHGVEVVTAEEAVTGWQKQEQTHSVLPDYCDCLNETVVEWLVDEQTKASRNQKYNDLLQLIQSNSLSLQAFRIKPFNILPYDNSEGFYILTAQIQEKHWLSITTSIPVRKELCHHINNDSIKTIKSSLSHEVALFNLQLDIKQILEQLSVLRLGIPYPAGYGYGYDYQLFSEISTTQESAIVKSLISAQVLELTKFKSVGSQISHYTWDYPIPCKFRPHYEMRNLTKFLKNKLTDIQVYKIGWYDSQDVYVIGKTPHNGDRLGIVSMTRGYPYNP